MNKTRDSSKRTDELRNDQLNFSKTFDADMHPIIVNQRLYATTYFKFYLCLHFSKTKTNRVISLKKQCLIIPVDFITKTIKHNYVPCLSN